MKKRFLAFVMAMIMVLAVGCGGASSNDSNKDVNSNDATKTSSKSEITKKNNSTNSSNELKILAQNMPGVTEFRYEHLLKDFEEQTGIKVTIEKIDEFMPADYAKKVVPMLHSDNVPTLMYIEDTSLLDRYNKTMLRTKLVDMGAAEKVSDKVSTYDTLLDLFKTDYFIPVGIHMPFFAVPNSELEKAGLQNPGYNLSEKEIYDIWYNITPEKPVPMDVMFYNQIIALFSDINFKRNGSEVSVSFDDFVSYAEQAKAEIKSDKFDIKAFDDYEAAKKAYTNISDVEISISEILKIYERMDKFENYFMLPLPYMWNFSDKIHFYKVYSEAGQIKNTFNKNEVTFVPESYLTVRTAGFMVTKNGKNKDNAYKFLEWITSESMQNKIAESAFDVSNVTLQFYGPVLKNTAESFDKHAKSIEKEIPSENKEMISSVYSTLEDKKFIDMYMTSRASEDMNTQLLIKQYTVELLFDYIFKEDLTDDDIKAQLKTSIAKLNTFLSEFE